MAGYSSPLSKRAQRQCHFDSNWPEELEEIGKSSKGKLCIFLRIYIILYTIIMCNAHNVHPILPLLIVNRTMLYNTDKIMTLDGEQ